MDLCDDGDLYKIIKDKKPMSEEQLRNILIQLFDGLDYLHSKSIIHRDIKPNNIMLISDGTIKIGDLGLARESTEESATTFCGTIEYMSPEQRTGLPYDLSVDIWAAGMIVFELLVKKRLNYSQFMSKKQKYLDDSFESIKNLYSNDFFEIVSSCLSQNATNRPTAKDILMKLKGDDNEGEIPTNLMTENFDETNTDISVENESEEDEDSNPESFLSSFTGDNQNQNHLKPSISLTMNDGLSSVLSDTKSPKITSSTRDFKESIHEENNEFIHLKYSSNQMISFQSSYSSRYLFNNPSKIYSHKEVIKWSSDRVGKWLKEMNLDEYKDNFTKNDINGEILLELNDISEFIQFLNIRKLGHIKMIQKYIQLMREKNE